MRKLKSDVVPGRTYEVIVHLLREPVANGFAALTSPLPTGKRHVLV